MLDNFPFQYKIALYLTNNNGLMLIKVLLPHILYLSLEGLILKKKENSEWCSDFIIFKKYWCLLNVLTTYVDIVVNDLYNKYLYML